MERELESLREAAKPLDELCELTDLLVAATLVQAGYYRHHRGEWRRKREKRSETETAKAK
jgi:hypothetical protein